MSKPTTYVLIVADMSGSMHAVASEVRSSLNGYIADLRKSKADSGTRYRVSLTVFHSTVMPLCVAARLADVPELTEVNYRPNQFTALLDAVGRTITEFETRVALAAADRVLLVIQTDGHENASREFSWRQVRNLLDARDADGNWSIVYLGQGADAWDQAGSFGGSTQTVDLGRGPESIMRSYEGLAVATVAYADGGSARDVGVAVAAAAAAVADPSTTQTPARRSRTGQEGSEPMSTDQDTAVETDEAPEAEAPQDAVAAVATLESDAA